MKDRDARVSGTGARKGAVSVAATLAVALTACTTGSTVSAHRTAEAGSDPPPPPPTAGASGRSPEHAAILSAWLAAEHAFESAASTADPGQPDLAATTIAPQLGATQALLEEMQASGEVARGPARFGIATVQVSGPDSAKVISCLDDAEIVISAATGQPVPGVPGEVAYELVTSTMELFGREWKLESQTVEAGKCGRSS